MYLKHKIFGQQIDVIDSCWQINSKLWIVFTDQKVNSHSLFQKQTCLLTEAPKSVFKNNNNQ